ncbi:hypothetical protein Tsubulata_034378 [Turnera subulata]|uniref:Bifunctional inhibitor/plant lipid transfer protein/seed storage helical domain-containing protein n=1 Tax=Turnera subulata TaxID=218843 RepID=A0A9Q0JKM7_9ROSI|nr:hypothetical protein Tsubulata_034378 [Turnera subulata]
MASKGIELGLLLMMVLRHGAMAQSGCTSTLVNLAPCLNYVTGNSSTPSSSCCCSGLASSVQSPPQCLCTLVNGGGSSLGITINKTLVLWLLEVCKVQTPYVQPVHILNHIFHAANGSANQRSSSVASPLADSPNETTEAPTETSLPSTPAILRESDLRQVQQQLAHLMQML